MTESRKLEIIRKLLLLLRDNKKNKTADAILLFMVVMTTNDLEKDIDRDAITVISDFLEADQRVGLADVWIRLEKILSNTKGKK